MRTLSAVFAAGASMAVCTAAAEGNATWVVVTPTIDTIAAACSFTSATTGFVPGSASNAASAVLKTTDSGKDWTPTTVDGMNLGLATSGDRVVTAGLLTLLESTNGGQSYHKPLQFGGNISQSQYVAAGSNLLAAVGQDLFGTINGISVTTSTGAMQFSNISVLSSPTRYAALPGASTWYVSAGSWPSDEVDTELRAVPSKRLSRHWGVMQKPEAGVRGATGASVLPLWRRRVHEATNNGFVAQIAKTTDAGKTWTQVYNDPTGSFYFNQISCRDEQTCCAAGESDGGDNAGARILCSYDGGSTWEQNLMVPGAAESMFTIRFMTDSEVWAGGATLSDALLGKFYRSTDAGKTWTMTQTLDGQYPNDFCGMDGTFYASAFNAFDTSSFLGLQE